MGIKTLCAPYYIALEASEKPPHHMGIKTERACQKYEPQNSSEKPPHHMGIKTGQQ